MSARYPADDARDAIALAEAAIRRDVEATRVITGNCDLGVVEMLTHFLDEALKLNRHIPAHLFLANMRYGFAVAFADERWHACPPTEKENRP